MRRLADALGFGLPDRAFDFQAALPALSRVHNNLRDGVSLSQPSRHIGSLQYA